jgi:hypothetical protein
MPSRASSRTRTAARLKGTLLPDDRADDRARRLRLFATGLLLVMAVLFSSPARPNKAADRPAGLPARLCRGGDGRRAGRLVRGDGAVPASAGAADPHTAIIPENKDRLADSMASFLRENFLTPQVVARRLAGMNAAAMAGGFLADPRGGEGRVRAARPISWPTCSNRSIRKSWAASPRGPCAARSPSSIWRRCWGNCWAR